MAPSNLQEVLDAVPAVELLAQLPDRRLHLSGRRRRVHQLAPRAAGVARDGRAVRPVAPHGEPLLRRARRAEADLATRRSTASRTSRSTWPSSTSRPRRPGTSSATASSSTSTPDEFVFVGRAPAANWLQFHARDRRLRRRDREGRPLADAADRASRSRARSGGSRSRARTRGRSSRRSTAAPLEEVKFFRMSDDEHRRPDGADAAPRHGRRARPRDLGAVRDLRRGAGDDPRGRQGVRPRAGRLARVLLEHARVGLDPVAAAGDLLRRGAAGVPRVAPADELRGRQRARRQLRLRRHRGLLPESVRARLRPVRQVRPRLPRPRGARGDRP